MPTYQYACTACDHAFEQFQSFTDDALTECPECEGRLRKVFNAVGVVFKGSGFYRTDSRSDSGSTSANGGKLSGDGGTQSDGGSKSDGSSSSGSNGSSSSSDNNSAGSSSGGSGKSDSKSTSAA